MIKLSIKCSDGRVVETNVSDINDIRVVVPSEEHPNGTFVSFGSTDPVDVVYIAETLFGFVADYDNSGQIVLYTDIVDPEEHNGDDCDDEDCPVCGEEYEEEEDFDENGESTGLTVIVGTATVVEEKEDDKAFILSSGDCYPDTHDREEVGPDYLDDNDEFGNLAVRPVFGTTGGTDEKRTGVRPSKAFSDRRGSTPRLPAK